MFLTGNTSGWGIIWDVKGLIHSTFSLDEEKSEAQSDYEYWDGYEKKISLTKLFAPYERELLVWIEDSPRRLFVKGVYAGGGEAVVEEISTIREKGMERP